MVCGEDEQPPEGSREDDDSLEEFSSDGDEMVPCKDYIDNVAIDDVPESE